MRDRPKDDSGRQSPEETDSAPAGSSQENAGQEAPQEARAEGTEGSDGSGGRLQELAEELDALRDRYLRTVAEYDNFRRRTERERAESGTRAQSQVVQALLDPLDDLQRVAGFGPDSTTVEALLEGVRMVEKKLLRSLEAAGLEVIDARAQPFDPTLHEALMTSPAESQDEDDTVGEVFQPGYQFQGILLRPARVQVRKYGE